MASPLPFRSCPGRAREHGAGWRRGSEQTSVVVFRNAQGGQEILPARPGQRLGEVLLAAGIPSNAVLARRGDTFLAEDVAVVADVDLIEVEQIRLYDLDVTRSPTTWSDDVANPVYSKSVTFMREGAVERRIKRFDAAGFVDYVESTFAQAVLSAGLFRPDDHVVVGLSGGRDSVAFLKLLQRTGATLPPMRTTAVTVTGLPDWEEPATFDTARRICAELDVEQVVVRAEDIARVFRLDRPFAQVMDRVASGDSRHLTMLVAHHVLRRMLEIAADERAARTIAFGFNADDLVGSLVTWFTSGFRMGGIPVREIGGRRYIFPLFRITKKELTLYLNLVAPDLVRQGRPGRFTVGTEDRSLAYAVADWLYDLWPGIDHYLFSSFAAIEKDAVPCPECVCVACGAVFLRQGEIPDPADRCDVCVQLQRHAGE
jgi:tRNA(Ile)-lysidine synthase TilS/MesJ